MKEFVERWPAIRTGGAGVGELPVYVGELIQWISIKDRMPDAERKEYIDHSPAGAHLYPCLVTRRSNIVEGRVYVAKHYYDGEDFVNNGDQVCTDSVIAWAVLPEPAEEKK